MSSSNSRLEAALRYCAWGWPNFPAPPGEKKSYKSAEHSGGRNWGATTDAEEIRRDFMRWPNANIGITTGPESGIFVLDIDTPEGHSVDGFASLKKLEAENGALPETRMAESPSGSRHFYFKYPADAVVRTTSKIAPGIDVRGDGGIVLAPPSTTAKGAYKWLNEGEVANAPEWLLRLVADNRESARNRSPRRSNGQRDSGSNGNELPAHLRDVEMNGAGIDMNMLKAEMVLIEAALKVIPSDNYQTWFEIGCALRQELGKDGFKLFDEWSSKSTKYDAEICRAKWEECARINKYSPGTIFHHANEASPGWRDTFHYGQGERRAAEEPPRDEAKVEPKSGNKTRTIDATPYVWVDPRTIPRRRWLYHPHYVRQFVSLTVSTGGVGKSSLIIVEALAMTSDRPLLGTKPECPLRVWYWNGEDPPDELQRRVAAAAKHYRLTPSNIGDRLFVDSGRAMPIVIATETRFQTQIAEPVIQEVIATAKDKKIDVIIIDPFVTCHRVNENDNAAIERVAKSWARVAEEANCSVMLVHHSRKTGGDDVTVDASRGASALLAAARTARTLNTMQKDEAKSAQIEERERRTYFRSDIGKANLTRPAEFADWFKLVSVDLGNADNGGDKVGVVTPWHYPRFDPLRITTPDIIRCQAAIQAGGPWREDHRSQVEPWVGIPIAQTLGIDPDHPPVRRELVMRIQNWLANGWLRRVEKKNAKREPKMYVEVGAAPDTELGQRNAGSENARSPM